MDDGMRCNEVSDGLVEDIKVGRGDCCITAYDISTAGHETQICEHTYCQGHLHCFSIFNMSQNSFKIQVKSLSFLKSHT